MPCFSEGRPVIIDAADLPLVRGKRWNWSPSKSTNNSNGGSIVLAMSGTPKPSLPRIILGIDDPEQLVCHRNGDRPDCRRENLVVRAVASAAGSEEDAEQGWRRDDLSPRGATVV
jgi:hypothetical protein